MDEAVTQGLEFATRLPLSTVWSSRFNYTHMRSEQKSESNLGKPLTDTPAHTVNASPHWQPGSQWSGWLRAEVRSDRFRDPGTSAATIAAKNALGDDKGYGLLPLGCLTVDDQCSRLQLAVRGLRRLPWLCSAGTDDADCGFRQPTSSEAINRRRPTAPASPDFRISPYFKD